MSAVALFTAAELASCLNCTPQNVRKLLKQIAPDGKKVVSGVEAAAWFLASLPSPLIGKLAQLATRHGFQNSASAFAKRVSEKLGSKPGACRAR